MILRGLVISGKGVAKDFTKLEWLKKQLISNFNIDPFPGTLNLKIDSDKNLIKWKQLKANPGIAIVPPETGWCFAHCYPAKIENKFETTIIVPEIENYPDNQIEILSTNSLRKYLDLDDGDPVTLYIYNSFEKDD